MSRFLFNVVSCLAMVSLLLLQVGCAMWNEDKSENIKVEDDKTASVNEQNYRETKAFKQYQKKLEVRKTSPVLNKFWKNDNNHFNGNLLLAKTIDEFEEYDNGKSAKDGLRLNSTPVIYKGKILTLDGRGLVIARNFENPDEIIWSVKFEDEFESINRGYGVLRYITGLFYDSEEFLGGNISVGIDDNIFVTTKRGFLNIIDANNGEVKYSHNFKMPIRSKAVQHNNLVFVTTIDNQTHAFDLNSKTVKWVNNGLDEKSKIYGSPSPLVVNDKVIVTYSSGEIYALDIKTGGVIWYNSVSASQNNVLNPSLNDISITPIVDEDNIYVTTSEGAIIIIDKNSGEIQSSFEEERIYSDIWIYAGYIYAVTQQGYLLIINEESQEVAFKELIADKETIEDYADELIFTAPIIASDNLYVADNFGTLYVYDINSLEKLSNVEIDDEVYLRPIIIDGKMLLFDEDAELHISK